MIILRKEQKDALRILLIQRQILGLVDHVKNHFPDETAGKSDDELFDQIMATLERAEKYGIKSECDVYQYINISMLYGADFDEKGDTAWTVDYLADEDVSSPTQRINRLFDEVVYRLEVEENSARIEKEFYGGSRDDEEGWDEDGEEDNEDGKL